MAKDKEKSVNPAAAQRKLEKQKALKKGKAAIAAQRTDRLAQRNPQRLQRQIDDLKELQASSGGKLSTRDQKQLDDFEKDVQRIKKAREIKGVPEHGPRRDSATPFKSEDGERPRQRDGSQRGRGGSSTLGKRPRSTWQKEQSSSGSETDASVRNIPMPSDTPPPIPFKPRASNQQRYTPKFGNAGNPNMQPLGEGKGGGERAPNLALPTKPAVAVAQTVYESQAAVRDLRKEAVSKFMPTAVRQKLDAAKGGVAGKLLEEEELAGLERAGYVGGAKGGDDDGTGNGIESQVDLGREERDLEEEERRFEREMRSVQMEEVDDGDG